MFGSGTNQIRQSTSFDQCFGFFPIWIGLLFDLGLKHITNLPERDELLFTQFSRLIKNIN